MDVLQTILSEVLDELKTISKTNQELNKRVALLEQKTSAFDQKLEQVTLLSPPLDTTSFNKTASENMATIAQIIEAQPKAVIKKHQILFFPEHETEQYYRFITGRILPYVILFFVVYFLFLLGREFINRPSTSAAASTAAQYQNAWARLDSIAVQTPGLRPLMDKAWLGAAKTLDAK